MSTSTQAASTPSDWPVDQSDATTLLATNDTDLKLEPSGMGFYPIDSVPRLYVVSSNGKIARQKANPDDGWVVQSYTEDGQHDFEAVTLAKGKLMIGIEGGDKNGKPTYAHILRFNPTDTSKGTLGSFTGSEWILNNPTPEIGMGMEAMTFIPDGSYPSSWGTSSYYGGLFIAGFQSETGKIYVYDLPKGNGQTQNVSALGHFTSPLLSKNLSDLHYSTQKDILYVLYDDGTDSLQELVLNSGKTGFTQQYLTTPPYVGCEALTQKGSSLYIGLDQSSDEMTANGLTANYVYEYPNFTSHS